MARTAMVATPVLVLLSFAQDPAGSQADRLVWPPVLAAPQQYEVRLTKTRQPDGELAAAEKAARKALGLFVPSQSPRQSAKFTFDVQLEPGSEEVLVRYSTRLLEQKDLRLQLRDAAPGAPPLGNEHVDAIWGLADAAAGPGFSAPRNSLERTFEQRFRRHGTGVAAADFRAHFGDHLLPVLWDEPLPCWIGHMANVLGLGKEAAIEGKTLMCDGSGAFPLGHRDTRVQVAIPKVSGRSFTLRYEMTVKQQVERTRCLKRDRAPPSQWIFDIAGEADYSAAEQCFERIREQVRARPASLDQAATARLRDEAFVGTIEVTRVRKPKEKDRPRR